MERVDTIRTALDAARTQIAIDRAGFIDANSIGGELGEWETSVADDYNALLAQIDAALSLIDGLTTPANMQPGSNWAMAEQQQAESVVCGCGDEYPPNEPVRGYQRCGGPNRAGVACRIRGEGEMMLTDDQMPPLPTESYVGEDGLWEQRVVLTEDSVREYGRAVEAMVREQMAADAQRIRDERDRLRAELADMQAERDANERDARRYEYILDCEVGAVKAFLPDIDPDAYREKVRAKHDAALAAQQGGDDGAI